MKSKNGPFSAIAFTVKDNNEPFPSQYSRSPVVHPPRLHIEPLNFVCRLFLMRILFKLYPDSVIALSPVVIVEAEDNDEVMVLWLMMSDDDQAFIVLKMMSDSALV